MLRKYKWDTCDAYSFKNVIFFARNISFKIAESLGYRYFITLEDDYYELAYRKIHDGHLLRSSRLTLLPNFNEMCEVYFRVLDSSPFLLTTALAQDGDYLGGVNSRMCKNMVLFKGMNFFFCDTHKQFEFKGRVNEDVNQYSYNSQRGKLSCTLTGIVVNQEVTQTSKGGMSELYRDNGTWLKSVYSVVNAPNCVTIDRIGWGKK